MQIVNYLTVNSAQFTEITTYTESIIIVEINRVEIFDFYSNPLTGFSVLQKQTIRFLDMKTGLPIFNIYIV